MAAEDAEGTKSDSDEVCERPPAAFGGRPPREGDINASKINEGYFSPSRGGEPPKAAGGGSHRIFVQSHAEDSAGEMLVRPDNGAPFWRMPRLFKIKADELAHDWMACHGTTE